MTGQTITIRMASAADGAALERLAGLDSARPPTGDVLLAEVDGELRAALGPDGVAVADPFHRTGDLVTLLRRRAGAAGERPRRARRRLGVLRRAHA
jgi:hypothetical protein